MLKPHVMAAWMRAKLDMEQKGIAFALTDANRTTEEQQALFAQGRDMLDLVNAKRNRAGLAPISLKENAYIVTKCDGINNKSNHQSGCAVDVVPVDKRGNPYWPESGAVQWLPIADAMKRAGFSWGGDWKQFPDFPHFEMSNGGKV
jgi:peptidoglycan L-alanyl-D-glutamate endopeptidase CwlK